MSRICKTFALILTLIIALTCLTALMFKPANAQTYFPAPTPESQTFSYRLPNGYTVTYEITSTSTGYLITLLVMDNPPIEISFNEQLQNGTEIEVTKYIAYGMTIASTSYPANITFTELNNQPTSTPSSTSSSTPSTISSPTVPEFSWLVIVPLILSVLAVAVVLRHRKNR